MSAQTNGQRTTEAPHLWEVGHMKHSRSGDWDMIVDALGVALSFVPVELYGHEDKALKAATSIYEDASGTPVIFLNDRVAQGLLHAAEDE